MTGQRLARGTCARCAEDLQCGNTERIVQYLTDRGRTCAESTIRRWASAGDLTALGSVGRRKVYRFADVHHLAFGICPYLES